LRSRASMEGQVCGAVYAAYDNAAVYGSKPLSNGAKSAGSSDDLIMLLKSSKKPSVAMEEFVGSTNRCRFRI